MHLDPISGMWKNDDNDYQPQLATDDLDEIHTENNRLADEDTPSKLDGKCLISILFENAGEYIKWQKYFGERKWDFIQSYPAIFRAEYSFHNSMDVEILAKKIVQLLEAGFDVHSANWELKKEEEIRK